MTGAFWLVTENGAPVLATVTTVSSEFKPPPPERLSRTVTRKFMVRAAVGMNSDQHACGFPKAAVSAGHGPGTFVFAAAMVVSRGR